MGLFECPDCGNKVSDRANLCPNCGGPLKEELAPVPYGESDPYPQSDPAKPDRTPLFIGLAVIATLFLAIGLITTVWSFVRMNTLKKDLAVQQGRTLARTFKKMRNYYTAKVIGNAKMAGIAPHFEYKTLRSQGTNSIPLPETFLHDMSDSIAKDPLMKGLEINLYSMFPFGNRANRKLDKTQISAWRILTTTNSNSSLNNFYVQEETINGKPFMRVFTPDVMTKMGCVNCHNNTMKNWGAPVGKQWFTPKSNWKMGDVRGVIEVRVPLNR